MGVLSLFSELKVLVSRVCKRCKAGFLTRANTYIGQVARVMQGTKLAETEYQQKNALST